MKWFKEVFLPSLTENMTINQSRWITEKQVDICLRYMKPDPWSPCRHYEIQVDGVWYVLSVMKKGYGSLTIMQYRPNST